MPSASKWPPPVAIEYVQSHEFIQTLYEVANRVEKSTHIETAGAFSVVYDWFEKTAHQEADYFQCFPSQESLEAYLWVALRRNGVKLARRDAKSWAPVEYLFSDPEPQKEVLSQEEFEIALKHLTDDELHVLYLSFSEHMRNKDIATKLGMRPDEVSKLRRSALLRIREGLTGGT